MIDLGNWASASYTIATDEAAPENPEDNDKT